MLVCASIIALVNTKNNTVTAQTTDTIAITDTIHWADVDSTVKVELKAWEKAHKPLSSLNFTDISAFATHFIPDYPIGNAGKTKPEIWAEKTNAAGDVTVNALLMNGHPVIQKTDANGDIVSVDGKSGDDPGLPKRDK